MALLRRKTKDPLSSENDRLDLQSSINFSGFTFGSRGTVPDGAVWYVAALRVSITFRSCLTDLRFGDRRSTGLKDQLVWVHNDSTPHEPFFYGWKEGPHTTSSMTAPRTLCGEIERQPQRRTPDHEPVPLVVVQSTSSTKAAGMWLIQSAVPHDELLASEETVVLPT